MSRTVPILVVVGAVVVAAAVGIAWRVKMNDRAAVAAVQPAPAAPTAPPAQAAAIPAEKSPPPAPPSAPAESRPAAAPAPAAVMAPSFDVARIGADGRAVIAGRAAPGARIVLIDGGKEIARGEADTRGEWVILAQDPPLAPGQHELRAVQHIEGRAPVTSEQVVIAVVPAEPATGAKPGAAATATITPPPPANRDQALVMISPSSGPATLLQSPSPKGVPRVGDLQLSTLDYDQHGQTTVTGQATPGATVRAYVDDRVVAESRAGADGHWKLAPSDPVDVGMHKLRLDRLAEDGRPTARLELAFERLVVEPNGKDGRRLHVVRGDNLWSIARAHYGEGWRYTVIFDANKEQIRDPKLIYPGQIFSLPKVN